MVNENLSTANNIRILTSENSDNVSHFQLSKHGKRDRFCLIRLVNSSIVYTSIFWPSSSGRSLW